jgi:hypothetical protein
MLRARVDGRAFSSYLRRSALARGLLSVTHACILDADGAARCWGRNGEAELGVSGIPFSGMPIAAGLTCP